MHHKIKKWLRLNFAFAFSFNCKTFSTFHRAANERSSPTSPCHPHDLPAGTQILLITWGFMCSIQPLTLRLRLGAAIRPLFLISFLLMASYRWGSKLQRLGGGVLTYTSVFFLRVPDYTAPALPPLPPPDCPINQSNLLNVVFCLRMRIGEKMHIFRPIEPISAFWTIPKWLHCFADGCIALSWWASARVRLCAASNMFLTKTVGGGGGGVRGACNLNIGDDLSGVLSSAPTIDALCTHGLSLEAADGNRIAEGISPANDMENHRLPDLSRNRAPPGRCCQDI